MTPTLPGLIRQIWEVPGVAGKPAGQSVFRSSATSKDGNSFFTCRQRAFAALGGESRRVRRAERRRSLEERSCGTAGRRGFRLPVIAAAPGEDRKNAEKYEENGAVTH